MTENTAQPTRPKVPEVASPDFLGLEALDQLANDCLNAVALVLEPYWPRGLLPFGRFERRDQVQIMFIQSSGQFRAPVIAVTQYPTGGVSQDVLGYRCFVNVSWGNAQTDDLGAATEVSP